MLVYLSVISDCFDKANTEPKEDLESLSFSIFNRLKTSVYFLES